MTDYSNPSNTSVELPGESLETIDDTWVSNMGETTITLEFPEFRHRCPISGRPDQGVIVIEYEPDESVIEEKSLRDFLYAFEQCSVWHERAIDHVVERIFADANPKWVTVEAMFEPRGNITTTVTATRD